MARLKTPEDSVEITQPELSIGGAFPNMGQPNSRLKTPDHSTHSRSLRPKAPPLSDEVSA